MAIQLLGLREYETSDGKKVKNHAFFDKDWRAGSVEELFQNFSVYVNQIPESDRFNMYFTVCDCIGLEPRDFASQSILPLDIDNIDITKVPETVECVIKSLGLDYLKTGVLFSGNGLQFFIKSDVSMNEAYFQENRIYYKYVVKKVNEGLRRLGLDGTCDPSVFSPKRLMRLPGTLNVKPGKESRMAYLIQAVILPQNVELIALSGVQQIRPEDQISPKALKKFPKPDTNAVLKECEFLVECKKNPGKISEAEWYASLSILGHLENGHDLAQEYSKGHPKYSYEETSRKLEQALQTAGPRTCKNIEGFSDKCLSCKHYNSEVIKSPIMIQGADYIRTKDTGFYDVIVNAETGKTTRKPNYNDLLKYFTRQHEFFVNPESLNVYVFNKTHWTEMPHNQIKAFAEDNFNPKPQESMRNEFLNKVLANNMRANTWFQHSTDRKINLQNGVFDIEKNQLLDHSKDFFFTGILPYAFDHLAKAPRFKKFMKEITLDRQDLEDVLLEFSGYCISGDHYWIHKALILHGEGSNGKSTFMEVLKGVVGDGLYASLSLTAMEDDRKRYMLDGKLFNVGEETHVRALSKSESFKILSAGGEMDVRRLYQQPYQFRNKAKLIFACNELPYSSDTSEGFYRRLLIVPFDAKFKDGESQNKNLKKELLDELPGILNIFIENYKKLKAQDSFSTSKTIQAELEAYRYDNDNIHAWFREDVEVTGDEKDFVTTDELFAAFQDFCQRRKVFLTYSYIQFSKWLKKSTDESRTPSMQRKVKGKNLKGYRGMKLETSF